MNAHFETTGFSRFAQLDDFEQGCIGRESDSYVDHKITAKTVQEMREKIVNVVGGTLDDQEIDACEEPGRIDVGRMENSDGLEPSQKQLEAWRNGQCKLWYVVYSFRVDSVTRQPANLSI